MSRFLPATVLFTLITALAATSSLADTPDCPYPCLPPPTSGGTINGYPPPPPASTGSSGSGDDGFGGNYPPPPPGGFGQLTPPGVMPGFLAPPYSAVPAGPAPPPPNPILPWYPWYYQHNNPITGSTTSAASPPPAVHRRTTCVGALRLQMCALVILLRAL